MTILLIGDCSSVYNISFVKALKKKYPELIIDLLDTNFSHSDDECFTVYGKLIRRCIPLIGYLRLFWRVPKLGSLVKRLSMPFMVRVVKSNNYNAILVQGLFLPQCYALNHLHTNSAFKIGVLWGSDLYKCRSENRYKSVRKAVSLCDRICVSTDKFKEDFLALVSFDKNKVKKCHFGLDFIEKIRISTVSPFRAKQLLRVPSDTFVITCGYNASPNQQHEEIITQLQLIHDEFPSNYLLVFPMTYSGNNLYKQQIEDLLNRSGLRFKIYMNFMKDDELIAMRKMTNIFIQLQRTDAFSGSLQEHLYCQNIVVTGSWLPYKVFKDKGIIFQEIDRMVDLADKLKYIFSHYEIIQSKVSEINTEAKFDYALWDNAIIEWYQILSEYRNPS